MFAQHAHLLYRISTPIGNHWPGSDYTTYSLRIVTAPISRLRFIAGHKTDQWFLRSRYPMIQTIYVLKSLPIGITALRRTRNHVRARHE